MRIRSGDCGLTRLLDDDGFGVRDSFEFCTALVLYDNPTVA